MTRLATFILLGGALLGLSGCYVAPAPGGYYRAPVVTGGVYAAPRPYYRPYGYRPAYGYGYGYRRYGYWR
jgi:hypothetical protein